MEKGNWVKRDGNTALSNDISDNAVLEQSSRHTRKQVVIVASLLAFLLPATQYRRYQYYCSVESSNLSLIGSTLLIAFFFFIITDFHFFLSLTPQNKKAQCCETVTIFLSFRFRLSTSSFWQVPVPVRQHCQYPPDFIIPDHRGLSLSAKSPIMSTVRSVSYPTLAHHAFQTMRTRNTKWMRINAFASLRRMLNPENKVVGISASTVWNWIQNQRLRTNAHAECGRKRPRKCEWMRGYDANMFQKDKIRVRRKLSDLLNSLWHF